MKKSYIISTIISGSLRYSKGGDMKVKLRYRKRGVLELIADYVKNSLMDESVYSKSSFRQLTQITK
jgi:hypothetical protein